MLSRIITKAKDLGFLKIGFSKPERPVYFDRYYTWISENKHADMSWLERNIDKRENSGRLLRGCRTIISLAYPYPSHRPVNPDGLCVSRYSQPGLEDYHFRLKRLCRDLGVIIRELYAGSRIKICVDSAPILEKSVAASSGIGFTGKNTLLIIPDHGSYFYLAEILTTALLEFPQTEPAECRCDSCTLCVESCPTGALEKPFLLDASKCLSFLSIEYKGDKYCEDGKKMGDCFFGCDRCQAICPFNEGEESQQISLPSTNEFLRMGEEDFQTRFGKTTLARAGLEKIKKNIRAIV